MKTRNVWLVTAAVVVILAVISAMGSEKSVAYFIGYHGAWAVLSVSLALAIGTKIRKIRRKRLLRSVPE